MWSAGGGAGSGFEEPQHPGSKLIKGLAQKVSFELRMDDGAVILRIKDDASLLAAVDWCKAKGAGKAGGVLRVTVHQRNHCPLRSAFKKTLLSNPSTKNTSFLPEEESPRRPSTTERLENFQSKPE
mmetsp:Transcript_12191/g.20698  ORF Transcript_12191/g.20698 Transcript_12191/m.20698 type:complete len:126 (+) Transcript_12191:1-378(+)